MESLGLQILAALAFFVGWFGGWLSGRFTGFRLGVKRGAAQTYARIAIRKQHTATRLSHHWADPDL